VCGLKELQKSVNSTRGLAFRLKKFGGRESVAAVAEQTTGKFLFDLGSHVIGYDASLRLFFDPSLPFALRWSPSALAFLKLGAYVSK
jgi:hypothetical protein